MFGVRGDRRRRSHFGEGLECSCPTGVPHGPWRPGDGMLHEGMVFSPPPLEDSLARVWGGGSGLPPPLFCCDRWGQEDGEQHSTARTLRIEDLVASSAASLSCRL